MRLCYLVSGVGVKQKLSPTSAFSKMSAMKHESHSRTRKRKPARAKTRNKTRATKKPIPRPKMLTGPITTPTTVSKIKACEEVEVGDVGGFGSPEELEAHEKRCGQEAAEFCHTCGRNLCVNHYELLHRDHEISGQKTEQALTTRNQSL